MNLTTTTKTLFFDHSLTMCDYLIFLFYYRYLGPFHEAIAVPSVTRCRCRRRRGHRRRRATVPLATSGELA